MSQGVFGFERDQMLACQTAHFVFQDMISLAPTMPRILPADADGATPPPTNAPEPIVTDHDDGAGFPADEIDVWNATMTWGGTPSINVVHEGVIPAAPFDQNIGCAGLASAFRSRARPSRSTLCRTGRCTGSPTGTTAATRRSRSTTRSTPTRRTATGRASAGTSSGRRPATGASEPGHVRPSRRPLPLDGRRRDGPGRQPRDRLLDRKRDCSQLSEPRLRRPAGRPTRRTRSARARRSCTPGRARRPALRSAGATTR